MLVPLKLILLPSCVEACWELIFWGWKEARGGQKLCQEVPEGRESGNFEPQALVHTTGLLPAPPHFTMVTSVSCDEASKDVR